MDVDERDEMGVPAAVAARSLEDAAPGSLPYRDQLRQARPATPGEVVPRNMEQFPWFATLGTSRPAVFRAIHI